jgi:alkylhydroperoxidase family enzyme
MNPRIEPAQAPYAAEVQQTFERLMPPGVPPLVLFTTLARSPRAFSKFMAAGLLDKGPLPMREREVMIHRTCARAGSEYEWGVHVALFSARVEFTTEQIAATVDPGVSDVWSPREALIVRMADALHETATIGEDLWAAIAAEFSEEQILELIMLAGFYRTVAYLTNGLKLPLEGYAARFPRAGERKTAQRL